MPTDPWEKRAGEFTDRPWRTALRWGAGLMVLLFVLGALGGVLGWFGDWGSEAKRVTGPDNTRQQAFELRDAYTSLEATAGNVCDAKEAESTGEEGDPTMIETPGAAFRQNYRRIKADYDRRMSNAFEAGWVRRYPMLNDLPREAPTLDEALATAGCGE